MNCRTCGESYHDDISYCPRDGSALVPVDPADPMVGRLVGGRFRVVSRIGQGGFGVVYVARQETVDREVALKVMSSALAADVEAVQRFFQEARVVSRLGHRGTAHLYDFGQTEDGILYIAMEFVRGRTLTEVLRAGPLSATRALSLAAQICDALDEAHRAGVVHRDLKPDNLMIEQPGGRPEQIRILDFGIAKLAGETSRMTRTGAIFGTPAYMSPEQCRGEPVDGRADLYALGAVLYEMLTGQPPFRSATPMGLIYAQVHASPRPLSDTLGEGVVPGSLEAVVARLLAKDAADRPGSALAAREAFVEVLRQVQATSPRARTHGPAEPALAETLPRLPGGGETDLPAAGPSLPSGEMREAVAQVSARDLNAGAVEARSLRVVLGLVGGLVVAGGLGTAAWRAASRGEAPAAVAPPPAPSSLDSPSTLPAPPLPVAAGTATSIAGRCPWVIRFDGQPSRPSAADRPIVTWRWDADGDGLDDGSGLTFEHVYPRSGRYTARLSVSDDTARAVTARIQVDVRGDNQPPVAQVGQTPRVARRDRPLVLDGATSADPDASCGDSVRAWRWDTNGNGRFDDAGIDVTGPRPAIPWATLAALPAGTARMRLEVEDTAGATSTADFQVVIPGREREKERPKPPPIPGASSAGGTLSPRPPDPFDRAYDQQP